MKLLLTMLALCAAPAVLMAQESTTTQCIEVEGGSVCVDTRIYLQAGETPVPPQPAAIPYANAGAHLPLDYQITDLGGTPRFVAIQGTGTTCSEQQPCPSLKNAHDKAVDGDPIIVRGGTYGNVGNTLSNGAWGSEMFITKHGIQVYPYPGETVIFDGSVNVIGSTWTTEGNLKWTAYTPRPCGNGFGITFCSESSADNVNGSDSVYPYNVGKWIDQVWVDGDKLQEVAKKTDINDSRFFVDRSNNRVYLTKVTRDAAKSEVAVCNRGDFITVHGHDVELAGFIVRRYCNSPAKAAMLDVAPSADRFAIHDVEMDDATIAFFLQGTSSDALEDVSIEHITITDMNWMGINTLYAAGMVVDGVRISGMDPWDEYAASPASGAIKTSRLAHTVVKDSIFRGNSSQGVWFDQSNFDTDVFGNLFEGTGVPGESSMFFYEISHDLDFYNNVIIAPVSTALKIAGSGYVRILNNTVVGGKDTLGIYADTRSLLDCATTGKIAGSGASCGGYSSDRWAASWEAAPPAMDWLTRMSVVQGNILAYPVASGLCSGITGLCINRINGPANLKLDGILPKDVKFDCNVYAASGDLVRHSNPTSSAMLAYRDIPAFSTAMAQASPYPAVAIEEHGLSGAQYVNADGTPTAALKALTSPCGFPEDVLMNATIPAGTKHYGVTYQ